MQEKKQTKQTIETRFIVALSGDKGDRLMGHVYAALGALEGVVLASGNAGENAIFAAGGCALLTTLAGFQFHDLKQVQQFQQAKDLVAQIPQNMRYALEHEIKSNRFALCAGICMATGLIGGSPLFIGAAILNGLIARAERGYLKDVVSDNKLPFKPKFRLG